MEITLPTRYSLLTAKKRMQVRRAYIELQQNKCWFCKEGLDTQPPDEVLKLPVKVSNFPPNFFNYPVHLQHNHSTDMTEGAVHAYCNAVLWEYFNR